MRRATIALALLVGMLGVVAPAWPAETPIPPAPTRWVTDQTGFISESTRSELDARLERYEQSTGHQVIVWIGTTVGGAPLEEWAANAFRAWGIGRRGKDDGVAVFVFPADRKMRIEVGYGVEDLLPDAYASRIVGEVMTPALKEGRNDDAIRGAVDQILSRLGGDTASVEPLPTRPTAPSSSSLIFGVLAIIGLLILLVTRPQLAMWVLWSIFGGGGGGFGGGSGGLGGGGGFGGGGGRSGGGGASGGW